MATATGTIVGTKWYGGNTSYATDQASYAGYDGGLHRVTCIKLTTPTFTGQPTALVINMYPYMGVGTDVTLRWAICTSDSNYASYYGTTSTVTDSSQIASGTVTISSIASSVSSSSLKTLTLSNTAVKSNTTYYVMLWSAGSTGMGISAVNTYLPTGNCFMTTSVTYSNTYTVAVAHYAVKVGGGYTLINTATNTVTSGNTFKPAAVTPPTGNTTTGAYFSYWTSGYGTHLGSGSLGTDSITVTQDIVIEVYYPLATYKLTISQGTGSTVTVKKGSTTLASGDTITYGDVLTITFGANTGYNLGTHTVNGSSFTSGGTHTVTGAVSVVSTASLKIYTLSISQGANSTITVKRNGTALSNGATITYGDKLVITFAANSGYTLSVHTVNGSTFTSGGTHTVTGNVTVVSSTSMTTYTVAVHHCAKKDDGGWNVFSNLSYTVTHGGSFTITAANPPTEANTKVGATYRYWTSGYGTFLGSGRVGDSIVVTTSIDLEVYYPLNGLVHIDNGTSFDAYQAYIDNGTSWDLYVAYIDNGTTWDTSG